MSDEKSISSKKLCHFENENKSLLVLKNRIFCTISDFFFLFPLKLWLEIFQNTISLFLKYSSVPNRRVGRNKRAGGKILKKH